MNTSADDLLFDDDAVSNELDTESAAWKLLVVDDEPGIHDVTWFVLEDVRFEGRGLQFLHAYNAGDACRILNDHPDVAVVLLDVVMETDHAGLELVKGIRTELSNSFVRIILRTGQPGYAPERSVILDYDINDYKEKTELSSQKLFSSVVTALRGYRDIMALEKNRRGLEEVIMSSGSLYEVQSLEQFIKGVLLQLEVLLHLGNDSFYSRSFGILSDKRGKLEDQRIIAGTGEFEMASHLPLKEIVDRESLAVIMEACNRRKSVCKGDVVVVDLQGSDGRDGLIYLGGCNLIPDEVDRHLLEVFASNASMALNNLYLNQEIEYGQRELMFSLGEIAEFRSQETSRHVARMSKVAEKLGRIYGLPDDECNLLLLAASMHDVGKIAIPDAILKKPGPFTDAEWVVMQSHCIWGEHLLKGSKRPLLRAATIVALQHHEKWDGSGYPNHLKGEEIHLYGRIAALADVFDALSHKRCYKDAWSLDDVKMLIQEQSGRHFDPHLAQLFIENFDAFVAIRAAYKD